MQDRFKLKITGNCQFINHNDVNGTKIAIEKLLEDANSKCYFGLDEVFISVDEVHLTPDLLTNTEV